MRTPPITDKPVCVTGASGFIAAQVVKSLLEADRPIRGTVRSLARADAHNHLLSLPRASTHLDLVAADPLDAPALAEALSGCEYVLHAARPYAEKDVKDPQRDLVEPALAGIRNVLSGCSATATVARVVLTSSIAAITDELDAEHALTEADWNERSSLQRNPYFYSKTMAEREAWRIMKDSAPPFDLVAINPFLVIGPSLTPVLNSSNRLLLDLLSGAYPGIVDIAWDLVDVRDVARAHVLAMTSRGARGRYICANETIAMRELVQMLGELGYGEYRLPRLEQACQVGDFAARLGSYLQPWGLSSCLHTHTGGLPAFDNSKIQRELGLRFRPLRETVRDTVEDLLRWGHLS